MAEHLADLNKSVTIRHATQTGTTTGNGTFISTLPITKPLICVYSTADSTSGAYTVLPEKNISANTWYFHVRKGVASPYDAVTNKEITVDYWYIDL